MQISVSMLKLMTVGHLCIDRDADSTFRSSSLLGGSLNLLAVVKSHIQAFAPELLQALIFAQIHCDQSLYKCFIDTNS